MQIYQFCEITRMIQAQSGSLVFFFDLCKSGYNHVKNFLVNNTRSIIDKTKLKILQILMNIKNAIKEFFQRENNSNEKLQNEIKWIHKVLTILIITTLCGLIFRR